MVPVVWKGYGVLLGRSCCWKWHRSISIINTMRINTMRVKFIWLGSLLTFCSLILHRNNPKFTNQPPQVTYVPIRPWALVWRVLYLLWEHGGHGHLRLWTHVSVLHLRPQTQEDVQRLLSHLQKADQRHYQDLPEHVKGRTSSYQPRSPRVRGRNV